MTGMPSREAMLTGYDTFIAALSTSESGSAVTFQRVHRGFDPPGH
jgi:hypothetical protein